jgi:hypothetical protein
MTPEIQSDRRIPEPMKKCPDLVPRRDIAPHTMQEKKDILTVSGYFIVK